MKILHTKKWMFAFFMPGFLCGILCVNLIIDRHLTDFGIFSEYFLKQYASVEVVLPEYMMYLAGVRLFPFLVITGLAFTRFRKVAAGAFLMWTGFSGGMLLAMGAFSMGIKGVLFCVIGLLPHFLLYIPAYIVLLWYAMTVPRNRWNRQKTIFVVLMMGMGLVLEGYVSPVLMKGFLKMIY